MSLETGGIHPLAKEADILLDTQLPANLLNVRADVIGDHVIIVLVDLRPDNPECDAIYLVDWKQGSMTRVSVVFFLHLAMEKFIPLLNEGSSRTKRDVRGRALRALPRSRPIPQTRTAIHRTLPRDARRRGDRRRGPAELASHPDARAARLSPGLSRAHSIHANGPAQRTTTTDSSNSKRATTAPAAGPIASVSKRTG
jgi:hypothetical protein